MIDLSLFESRRYQNSSLGSNGSNILSRTADDSKILGEIFRHYVYYISWSFRQIRNMLVWATTAMRRWLVERRWMLRLRRLHVSQSGGRPWSPFIFVSLSTEAATTTETDSRRNWRWICGGGRSGRCHRGSTFIDKFLEFYLLFKNSKFISPNLS